MSLRPAQRWSRVSQALHWLIGLLILGMGVLGLTMVQMDPSMAKLKVYALHKSIGLTVLMLVALRLLWRSAHEAPAPAPMPAWQRIGAATVHTALYLLMFAMPLSGWIYNSASNFPLQWFGWLQMPSVWSPDPTAKQVAHAIHEYGFWLLMALVALHAGAAVKHHVVDKDETLRRMLPGLPPPARGSP
ncbi:MAG: cytochrome b [Proteobacteria bacterium]|nr:cytochrome b [Pseudomonadota bacterium]